MKRFKCGNCHNESIQKDNILMVMCGCGYCMDPLEEKKKYKDSEK